MATMGRRLLRVLADFELLDAAQYGFVLDGSCIEPLSVLNRCYEHARLRKRPLHAAFLDATSAFIDSVPHAALDAALRRLGAPDDYITWLRSMLHGHRRAVHTAYGTSSDDDALALEAGTPQGCPASPVVWAIVVDFALAYAARADVGGEGYLLDDSDDAPRRARVHSTTRGAGRRVQRLAFADDLAAADGTHEGLRRTVQALILAMGAIGVRFNARKCEADLL